MRTINDRFNELIKALNLNPSSFARSIGKSYNAVESIVKNKTRPSYDVLEAMFQSYPDLNPSWLMTGEGEIFKEKVSSHFGSEVTDKIEEHFQKIEDFYHEQLRAKDQQIDRLWSLLGKPKGCPSVATLYQLRNPKKEKASQKGSIFLDRGYKFGYTPACL